MARSKAADADPIAEIAVQLPPRLEDVQISFGGGTVSMKVPAHVDDLLGNRLSVLISGEIRSAGKSRKSMGEDGDEDVVKITLVGDIQVMTARQAGAALRS